MCVSDLRLKQCDIGNFFFNRNSCIAKFCKNSTLFNLVTHLQKCMASFGKALCLPKYRDEILIIHQSDTE